MAIEKTRGDIGAPENNDVLRDKISLGKWVCFLREGTVGTYLGEVVGWYSEDGAHQQPRIQCGPEHNHKKIVLDEDCCVLGVWNTKPTKKS